MGLPTESVNVAKGLQLEWDRIVGLFAKIVVLGSFFGKRKQER
jgi:hypothetical protein